MSVDVIEFRFSPSAKWEPVPQGFSTATALVAFANYDLRVNGELFPAQSAGGGVKP